MILISTIDLVRGSRVVGDLVFPSLMGSLWLRFVRREVVRVSLVVFRVTGTSRLNSRSGSGLHLAIIGVRFISVRLVGIVLGVMA